MEDKAGWSYYLATKVILKAMSKRIWNCLTYCTISILQVITVKSRLQSFQSALPLWKYFLEVTTWKHIYIWGKTLCLQVF